MFSQPVPGGTLDPTTIPKYVQPLVIPPQMPTSVAGVLPAANYNIAVRQFKQQILPGGVWNTVNGRTDPFPATTIWSYGRAEDPLPDSSAIGGAVGVAPATNSTFNYPALTIENTSAVATKVRWINDLKDPTTGTLSSSSLPRRSDPALGQPAHGELCDGRSQPDRLRNCCRCSLCWPGPTCDTRSRGPRTAA